MSNFQQDFDGFIETVYPNGLKPGQLQHLKIAFAAGAICHITLTHKVGEIARTNERAAMIELTSYEGEVMAHAMSLAGAPKPQAHGGN